MDPMTGTSKCYGFVFFYDVRDAHAALSQREHFYGNPPRPFVVKPCIKPYHEDCMYVDQPGAKSRYYKFKIASKNKKRLREDEGDGYLPLDSDDDEEKHQRKKQRVDRFGLEDSSETTRSASATPRR